MDLIERAKVGALVYRILRPDVICRSDPNCIGRCITRELQIQVRAGMPFDRAVEVLFHELMHALADALGIEVGEPLAQSISHGWLMLLKDNPGLAELVWPNRNPNQYSCVTETS